MRYGKKHYLKNIFGHGPELEEVRVEQAREASRRLQRQRPPRQQPLQPLDLHEVRRLVVHPKNLEAIDTWREDRAADLVRDRALQPERQTWQQAQNQANAAILAEVAERVRVAEDKEKRARAEYRKAWKRQVRLSVLAEKTFPYYKIFSREAAAIRRQRRLARHEIYRPGGLDDIVDAEYAKLEIAIDEADRVRLEARLARQIR